jgi:cytochrome c551/c552
MSSRVQNLQNNAQLIELYGKNLKPPSYHEIRIKYLKQEVQRTMKLVAEIKEEWKQTWGTIMCLQKFRAQM